MRMSGQVSTEQRRTVPEDLRVSVLPYMQWCLCRAWVAGLSQDSGAAGSGSFGTGLDPELWSGYDDQESAVRMRLLTSKALGELCVKLQGQVSAEH